MIRIVAGLRLSAVVFVGALACANAPAATEPEPHFPKYNFAGVPALFARYACEEPSPARGVAPSKADLRAYPENADHIRAKAEAGVGFACRFAIAEWGCGTACQTGVAVDLSSGAINVLPTSEWGREFRADSFLLINNPPSRKPAENERPEYGYPAYFLWIDGDFELLFDTRSQKP